jgi:hypothetical protein
VLLSGLFIALSRLRDPVLQKKLKSVCCCFFKNNDNNTDYNLNTFLTTSLNTELVVSILKGVTILAASSSDNVDNMKENDMLKIK